MSITDPSWHLDLNFKICICYKFLLTNKTLFSCICGLYCGSIYLYLPENEPRSPSSVINNYVWFSILSFQNNRQCFPLLVPQGVFQFNSKAYEKKTSKIKIKTNPTKPEILFSIVHMLIILQVGYGCWCVCVCVYM